MNIYATIIVKSQVVSNNLGESEGNLGTLKKINLNGDSHILMSAETIRFGVRKGLSNYENTNRYWDETNGMAQNQWRDPNHGKNKEGNLYIDDDLLGYAMLTNKKSVVEGEEETPEEETTGRKKTTNTSKTRRSRIGHSPAISLLPFAGDRMFNAASPGATPSTSKRAESNSAPYGVEMIFSPFQYFFAVTPDALNVPERLRGIIETHMSLPPVGGKQNAFQNDFSPDSVVFRLTKELCPRIALCFEATSMQAEGNLQIPYSCPDLLRQVESGDILAEELIIGGRIASDPIALKLKELGATICLGVKQAGQEAINRYESSVKAQTQSSEPTKISKIAAKTSAGKDTSK